MSTLDEPPELGTSQEVAAFDVKNRLKIQYLQLEFNTEKRLSSPRTVSVLRSKSPGKGKNIDEK